MDSRHAVALLAAVVALSLVSAPVMMADWGEQAAFSVEQVDRSQVREETPVLQYRDLSPDAQHAVRRAIESPDGHHTVYGREDWPDRFFYSDYSSPGQGMYVVVYEGQPYRLTTYAGGGFPFVYWVYELPFVVYGVLLGLTAVRTYRGERPTRIATPLAAVGVAFHLLGPEFDFPLVSPIPFVGLGVFASVAVATGLLWTGVSGSDDATGG